MVDIHISTLFSKSTTQLCESIELKTNTFYFYPGVFSLMTGEAMLPVQMVTKLSISTHIGRI